MKQQFDHFCCFFATRAVSPIFLKMVNYEFIKFLFQVVEYGNVFDAGRQRLGDLLADHVQKRLCLEGSFDQNGLIVDGQLCCEARRLLPIQPRQCREV